MNNLSVEQEKESLNNTDILAGQLLDFVVSGWINEQTARNLLKLPHSEREVINQQIIEVTEDTSNGEQQRANWAAGILGREVLSQQACVVFISTTGIKPRSGIKGGLGTRAFTEGRHSSPDTKSSS
jgi:hypothetical protein